jgi:hypothetical protein
VLRHGLFGRGKGIEIGLLEVVVLLLFEESHNVTADSKILFFASKESHHLTLYFLIKIT